MIKLPRPTQAPAPVAALVAELLASRTATHALHLSISGPGSFAAHKALEDYYSALPDLVDTLTESYQGASEKLLDVPALPPPVLRTVPEAVAHLREIYAKCSSLQEGLPYSEVGNLIDEIKTLIGQTKYKLLFLS